MKNLFLVLPLLLLTGCKQFTLALFNNPTDVTPKLVMVSGQSNAERLYTWGGLNGWSAERQVNDSFVNCSRAGAKIDDFDDIGSIMKLCMQSLNGRTPDIILWYQGEADATPDKYAVHEMKTMELWQRFRSRWPHVQIVYAQLHTVDLSRWPGYDHWDDIKTQQAHYSFSHSIMVKTDDLPYGPLSPGGDGIHYDQPGDVLLGKRFAEGYKRLSLED